MPKHIALPPRAAQLLVELIDELVEAKFAAKQEGLELVSQADSPLGRRRHVAAAKRRLEAGDNRAGRAGRTYFLTRAAIDEELGRMGRAQVESVDDAADERADLLGELGLKLVAGGRR